MQNCDYCCSAIAKKKLSCYLAKLESNSKLTTKLDSLEIEVKKLQKENFELKEILLENERKKRKMEEISDQLKNQFKQACKSHKIK